MVSRGVFYIVTAILFVTGILLMAYQHVTFEIPFLPGVQRTVWQVEAKVEFEPLGDVPVTIDLVIPDEQPHFFQLGQTTACIGYGSTYLQKENNSYIEWTKRNPIGLQTLYYRGEFLSDQNATASSMLVPSIPEVVIPEPYATAIGEIATTAHARSSNPFSFTVQAISELERQQEMRLLLLQNFNRAELLLNILHYEKIPARIVYVLDLEDGRRNRTLVQRLAVFDGTHYEIFDPISGTSGISDNQLIWSNNGGSLLDIQGGKNGHLSFSIIKSSVPVAKAGVLKVMTEKAQGNDVVSLSVESLPLEEQSMFKGILLLPIGVLIVVFLRIIIGIKTSGTFMPVLIAMAFLQTSLTVGLIGFVSIVCIGLIVRSWLSHLNLLLVARISAVIIVVIGIIGAIALLTYKIGLTEGIKVTFFPMIILSWTIERMSILWEEEGYKEVLKQGGGSLFVAVCAFIAMDSLVIQHLTFNFLGLQLVILSLVLIMGNYTGFRLSELKRFKPLVAQINDNLNGDEKEHEYSRLKKELGQIKKNPHAFDQELENPNSSQSTSPSTSQNADQLKAASAAAIPNSATTATAATPDAPAIAAAPADSVTTAAATSIDSATTATNAASAAASESAVSSANTPNTEPASAPEPVTMPSPLSAESLFPADSTPHAHALGDSNSNGHDGHSNGGDSSKSDSGDDGSAGSDALASSDARDAHDTHDAAASTTAPRSRL